MPKRSSTTDFAQIAHSIVEQATGEALQPTPPKNPAAVALGRLGGLKGGRARSISMTAEERAEIARKAALARWGTSKEIEP